MQKKKNYWLLIKRVYRFLYGSPKPRESWEKEFPDLKFIYLIQHSEKKFAIGIDKDFDLDWQTTTEFDEAEESRKSLRANVLLCFQKSLDLKPWLGKSGLEPNNSSPKEWLGKG